MRGTGLGSGRFMTLNAGSVLQEGFSMPTRAYWSGRIRLALVSIPVEILAATKSTSRISFNQIHEPSGKRIRYEKVVPGIGPVEAADIVKGYEVEKNKYVLLDRRGDRRRQARGQEVDRPVAIRRRGRDRRGLFRPAVLHRAVGGGRGRGRSLYRAARRAEENQEDRARSDRGARAGLDRGDQALWQGPADGDAALRRRDQEGGCVRRIADEEGRCRSGLARRGTDPEEGRRRSSPRNSRTPTPPPCAN